MGPTFTDRDCIRKTSQIPTLVSQSTGFHSHQPQARSIQHTGQEQVGRGKGTAWGELTVLMAALHGHRQATHHPGLPRGYAYPAYCCEK